MSFFFNISLPCCLSHRLLHPVDLHSINSHFRRPGHRQWLHVGSVPGGLRGRPGRLRGGGLPPGRRAGGTGPMLAVQQCRRGPGLQPRRGPSRLHSLPVHQGMPLSQQLYAMFLNLFFFFYYAVHCFFLTLLDFSSLAIICNVYIVIVDLTWSRRFSLDFVKLTINQPN